MVSIAAKPIEVNASTLADRAMQALYEDEHSPIPQWNAEAVGEIARRLLTEVLGIEPRRIRTTGRANVVEVEGVTFTAELSGRRAHGEVLAQWELVLWYLCPKCQTESRISDSIRSMADLGRALTIAETGYCWRCGR